MEDTTKIALAAAVAGGYVLGRTKKARVAFSIATYLAGRRFGLDPKQLVTQGLTALKDIPQVAEIGDQLRGEALDAGRQALSAAANRKLVDLADSLHSRTLAIGSGDEEEDEGEDEEEPEDEGRYDDEEEPEEEYEGEYEDEETEDGEEEPEEYEGEDEEDWEEEEEEPEEPEAEEEEEEKKPRARRPSRTAS
ncbi:histone protein, partial [Streptomyces sp. NPDC056542]